MLKNVGTFITQRHYNVPKNNKNASWNLVFSFIVFKTFQLIVKVFLNTKNNHEELITTEQVCPLWQIQKTNDKIM